MSVLPLSARLFPTVSRTLRVEAGGRTGDTSRESTPTRVAAAYNEPTRDAPPADPSEIVNALLDALDDAEMAQLEELDTEDIEVLARQMQLKGLRRQHPRGFLNVRA
jgi:CBS-domain-containing membrane protein